MNNTINRRSFAALLAGALTAAPHMAAMAAKPASQHSDEQEDLGHDMSDAPAHWTGNEHIIMLAYDKMTALDLVGPQYMFGSLMGATVEIAAKTMDPVVSDTGLTIMPDRTLTDIPKDLTVIFAPGGSAGTLRAMRDTETMRFMREAGERADYITSVCTGSILLGHAGLLNGYKATSHWNNLELLKEFGADPVAERVVIDRNRITGAGVSAGLDFGLTMVEMFRDRYYAETTQLLAEYDPQPPLDSGSPGKAKPDQVAILKEMFAGTTRAMRAEARKQG